MTHDCQADPAAKSWIFMSHSEAISTRHLLFGTRLFSSMRRPVGIKARTSRLYTKYLLCSVVEEKEEEKKQDTSLFADGQCYGPECPVYSNCIIEWNLSFAVESQKNENYSVTTHSMSACSPTLCLPILERAIHNLSPHAKKADIYKGRKANAIQ